MDWIQEIYTYSRPRTRHGNWNYWGSTACTFGAALSHRGWHKILSIIIYESTFHSPFCKVTQLVQLMIEELRAVLDSISFTSSSMQSSPSTHFEPSTSSIIVTCRQTRFHLLDSPVSKEVQVILIFLPQMTQSCVD